MFVQNLGPRIQGSSFSYRCVHVNDDEPMGQKIEGDALLAKQYMAECWAKNHGPMFKTFGNFAL